MPFLNRSLIEYIIQLTEGFEAVVARLNDNLEPLHAIYGLSCIKTIEGMFVEGDYQTNHLFERLKTRYVTTDEINRFDPKHLSFFNVNTEADMARAKVLAQVVDYSDTDNQHMSRVILD
jgi:molybdopterin-guanine dinucleotide biosynthesis protein A